MSRTLGNGAVFVHEGVRSKRCAGCKTIKPVEAFSQGSGPGGFHRHCRECCKAANKDYRERKKQQEAACR